MTRPSRLQVNDALMFVSVALWCVAVLAEMDVSVSVLGPGQQLRSGQDENNLIYLRRIELSGVSRSQLPLFVEDAEACYAACEEQRGGMTDPRKIPRRRCHLFTGHLSVHECKTQDCEAGIRVERAKDVESLTEQVEDIIKVPAERYRGLGLTCKEKSRYTTVSAVLAACGKVLRHCASAEQEVEPVPLRSVKCVSDEIEEDVNFYGSDFNNGFVEVALFPEDCCRKCMEAKNCRAWSRTASGQCWLKFDVPGDNDVKKLIGDAAGLRPELKAKCGERFAGITYEVGNPDSKIVTENITDIERCSVWSFFPLDQTCIQNYYLNGVRTKHPNVTTSFMVTVPEECDKNSFKDEASAEDIAAAYNPKCSAILKFGPKKPRPGCQEPQDAMTLFTESYDRIRRII